MNKIYHANQRSDIDVALGDFLNDYPEKSELKIMFLRESEGVYRFGSKKVYIKIEQGNKILVRVGGGYMHINEFIEKYTSIESDKI